MAPTRLNFYPELKITAKVALSQFLQQIHN